MQKGRILEETYWCILSVIQQMNSDICHDQIGHTLMAQTTIDVLEKCLKDMCQAFFIVSFNFHKKVWPQTINQSTFRDSTLTKLRVVSLLWNHPGMETSN